MLKYMKSVNKRFAPRKSNHEIDSQVAKKRFVDNFL
jgi:hypothetical protein